MTTISLPPTSPIMTRPFVFGVATSSFQIEGDAQSRQQSIWDTFCRQPGKIADNSHGDIACEHIKRWKEDVELIAELGVDAYRLSIAWPRVLTESGSLNQKGMDFYQRLIDALRDKGIKPFVTLYHWDLPQHLEDKGGWLNRETAMRFADYTDVVTRQLGDSVASYATFNEPFCSSFLGYEVGVHAPGLTGRKSGRQAAHHILLAHGLGMEVLNQNVPNCDKGIVLNFTPCYAASDKASDVVAAQWADQYINQWYMKPVMEGVYPEVIDQLPEQDRPDIHPGDLDTIRQPLDFLGVNFYTRLFYSAPGAEDFLYYEHPHQAPLTDIGWEVHPPALTKLLTDLHKQYSLPPVYITENGAAMADQFIDGKVNDTDRVDYYQAHLNALNAAMAEGVDVKGYFAWSLMDNFEWAEGYEKRFGIVHVDFDTQKRTIKQSGLAYKAMLSQRPQK